MSVRLLLNCDDCEAVFWGRPNGEDVAALRENAGHVGWRTGQAGRAYDYCPKHAVRAGEVWDRTGQFGPSAIGPGLKR